MTASNGAVGTYLNQKHRGLSVRCIKNQPSKTNSSKLKSDSGSLDPINQHPGFSANGGAQTDTEFDD